jgi:hypothetical protein
MRKPTRKQKALNRGTKLAASKRKIPVDPKAALAAEGQRLRQQALAADIAASAGLPKSRFVPPGNFQAPTLRYIYPTK